MLIYIIRHAESEANLLNEFSNTGRKHPLTGLGRAQARSLAQWLRGEGITRLYSSPLLRAEETATIISEITGIPVILEPALREINTGILEGKSDPASWEMFWSVWKTWVRGELDARLPDGESVNDVRQRFLPFFQALLDQCDPHERIVLITHGGICQSMLPQVLTNITLSYIIEHPLGNTDVVKIEVQNGQPVCLEWRGEPAPNTPSPIQD